MISIFGICSWIRDENEATIVIELWRWRFWLFDLLYDGILINGAPRLGFSIIHLVHGGRHGNLFSERNGFIFDAGYRRPGPTMCVVCARKGAVGGT